MAMLPSETYVLPISSSHMLANFQNIQMQHHTSLEKWIVVLLDRNTDGQQTADERWIKQRSDIATDIKLFINTDECVDFLTDVQDEKVCLILSKILGETLLPIIHDLPQLKLVYILDDKENDGTLWTNEWTKIKGSFPDLAVICDQFKQNIRKSEYDLLSISIVSPSTINNMNELDSSFMYSQLLKDTLLKMKYDKTAIANFVNYLRGQYANDSTGLQCVNTFEKEYSPQSSIWWYSKEVFIYGSLNRALRTQDTETIVRMGFYIQDLHREIERLHKEQRPKKQVIYRGQGMAEIEFEKLQRNNGGLLSFNSFLSTSAAEDVSRLLAESSSSEVDSVGILFRIEIDPLISSVPFASLENISRFSDEQEILFSMHTIFRIGEITNIDKKVWQVNLISTDKNDEELKQVTEYMRQHIQIGSADKSLAYLLFRMGEYDNAKKIYEYILRSTPDNDFRTRFHLYNMLGGIQHTKSAYRDALFWYQKILDMWPLPSEYSDLNLANIYNNMASVNHSMGDYHTASELYEIVVELRESSSSYNSVELGEVYNNIAAINNLLGHHGIALNYFKKSLRILESSLPPAYPDLAFIYNNIGTLNNTIGDRNIALRYFKKALDVQEKSLPPTHSNMTGTLNNLATTSHWIGQYQIAIEYYQRALKILEETCPSGHSDLAIIYNNIGQLHKTMGNYEDALPYYLHAIDIQKKINPSTDPKLAVFKINIATIYNWRGEFSIAMDYLKEALEIQKTSLAPTHPEFARTYNNMGMVYQAMKEYWNALYYYREAFNIQKEILSPTHPDLACIYNNLGGAEVHLEHYQEALGHIKETLHIQEAHLPPNHAEFARTYLNMGTIYMGLKKYSKAKGYFEKAMVIQETTLPLTHPDLGRIHNNLGMVNAMMGNYSNGLKHLQKAAKILAASFPPDNPELMKIHENIAKINQAMSLYAQSPWSFGNT